MTDLKPEPDPRLPVRVNRMGGALMTVLSWDQHLERLSKPDMFAIADIVANFPRLNTESAVDQLADLAGRYGQQLGRWFDELLDEYGIELIYLAFQCLEEFGIRSVGETAPRHAEPEEGTLIDMLEWFTRLRELEYATDQVVVLAGYLTMLGGWVNAKHFSTDELGAVLGGEIPYYVLTKKAAGDEDTEEHEGDSDGA